MVSKILKIMTPMTMYADRQKEPPEIVMYCTLFNTASSAAPSDSNVLKDVRNENSAQSDLV